MLTAGHCLCQTLKRDPKSHKDALCKSSHDNQIVPEKNEITIYGGSKDRSLLLALFSDCWAHPSEKAFIMDDPKDEVFSGTTDVGLVISYLPLFDKEELKTTLSIDYKPPVLPICLAAQD